MHQGAETMFRTATAAILSLSLSGVPVWAAERDADSRATESKADAVTDAGAVPDVDWSLAPVRFGSAPARSRTLVGLQVSLAGLQAFDAYSTLRGLASGAREANPLVRGTAKNPALFWTLKAATTAVPMVVAQRMWKKNRVGAVVVMALANSMAVAVAANNARVIGRQK